MHLADLAKTIRFDNASKGFDPLEGGLTRYIVLVCSEICEAHEELRDGHTPTEIYYSHDGQKPEGFPVEIADAIIRILDIQAKLDYEIKLIGGHYDFDPDKTLDDELLAVMWVMGRTITGEDKVYLLNLALTGLFQITENLNINILKVIDEKLAYNRTRPPKHGRQF